MFILRFLSKINKLLSRRVRDEDGLYINLLFPISAAFLLTFSVSRLVSHLYPWLYVPIVSGVRVHHFAYGFFVLIASGYLALLFDGPRARYLISLLHGFGMGLALDEYGMWLRLKDDDITRWSYDGFLFMLGLIVLIISIKPGLKMMRLLWPFKGQTK